MSQVALRLPEQLHNDIKLIADQQGVSMNHFLVYAITSKVAELKSQQAFVKSRTDGLTKEDAKKRLRDFAAGVPNGQILAGDEVE